MFSTVQQKFTSALSYFGYALEPSEGLPEKIYKTLENQDLTTQTRLHEHRITSKPPSIWKRVASLGMSYLFFSNGQSSLQQSPSNFTPWIPAVSFTTLSEPWAAPLTFMAGMSILPDVAHAQSPDTTFFKVLGGAADDYGYALSATSEGDVIVAGYTTSFGAGSEDVLLSKFSSNGTLVWVNTLGGANFDLGQALTATPEGDLIVAGSTGSFGAGDSDVLLSKFSSNGTLVWANILSGSGSDVGQALTTTLEGDLIVAGSTTSFGVGGSDMLLSKFSSNGTLVWVNTFGGTGSDLVHALTVTSEGDLIVAGSTGSFGAGDSDVLLSKFSSNGTLVWANTLGGEEGDAGYALTTTPEGDLIVAGSTGSFGVGSYDVLLSKFSSNGTLVWANTLGGGNSDQSYALTVTSEGDVIVVGYTTGLGVGGVGVLLSKFSSNGTLVWVNTLGGANFDLGYALTTTPEGDLIVTGYTNSFGAGNFDLLLAKLNAQGSIENCSAWQSVTPQVQSITPNITDVTLNMATGIPSWTGQDARSALNVTDITSLMNQTTVCYEQTAVSRTPTTSPQTFLSSQTSSDFSDTEGSSSISSSKSSFTASSAQSTSIESSQDTRESGIVSSSKSKIQSFSSAIHNASPTSAWSHFSSPSSQSTSMPVSSSNPSITEIPEPSIGTTPSITTLFYDQHYSIIVDGETIGTFYFTGGAGQLDSNNTNTLNIQLDGDIEDGETVTLFTIPEGEEPLWEDIILNDESESGCITTEGVFTTTSEEEHSYQLIFEYESSECSQSTATLKLAAIPVLGSGIL